MTEGKDPHSAVYPLAANDNDKAGMVADLAAVENLMVELKKAASFFARAHQQSTARAE